MTNEEIVARSICKSLNMGNDRFWAAYRAEARAVLAALLSAGRSCPQCAENERSMEIIRKAAERLTELEAAPDATDWKALCGAAIIERNAMRDKCMGCITPAEHADALAAAQAENEELRELLSQTVPFIRSAACDDDDHFVVEQREDLLHEVLAALSPPPLSPEKP